MADNHELGQVADKVVSNIQSDFKIVGKSRVHAWYAWAIVGIVLGMALAIVYVANRSLRFDPTRADDGIDISKPEGVQWGGHVWAVSNGWDTADHGLDKSKAAWPSGHTITDSRTWPTDHDQAKSKNNWPAGHIGTISPGWTGDPGPDGKPTEHTTTRSAGWPANHSGEVSRTWPADHAASRSKTWPPDHKASRSKGWPQGHTVPISPTWKGPPDPITGEPIDHEEARSLGWPPGHSWGTSLTYPLDHTEARSKLFPADHTYSISETFPEDHDPERSPRPRWKEHDGVKSWEQVREREKQENVTPPPVPGDGAVMPPEYPDEPALPGQPPQPPSGVQYNQTNY